eukprot:4750284-Alexandrium_andersonii.AAC.1
MAWCRQALVRRSGLAHPGQPLVRSPPQGGLSTKVADSSHCKPIAAKGMVGRAGGDEADHKTALALALASSPSPCLRPSVPYSSMAK